MEKSATIKHSAALFTANPFTIPLHGLSKGVSQWSKTQTVGRNTMPNETMRLCRLRRIFCQDRIDGQTCLTQSRGASFAGMQGAGNG